MRLFNRLGILLGSLHIILYFLILDYFSILDKVVPPVLGVPFMFICGYLWPVLVFFAFAPRRFQEEPDAHKFIFQLGRAFGSNRNFFARGLTDSSLAIYPGKFRVSVSVLQDIVVDVKRLPLTKGTVIACSTV